MKKIILLAAAMAATLPGKAQTDTIQYRTFQGYLNPHERGTIHIPSLGSLSGGIGRYSAHRPSAHAAIQ